METTSTSPLTFECLLVPDLLRRPHVVLAGRRDTQLRPAREPTAVEHLGPREPERAHHGHAAVAHGLAQAPAGAHRAAELLQAHGGEQRAQELLGVPVAQLGDEGQPGCGLLLGLPQRVVAQQVGHPHLPVADAVAQGQGARDGFAHRADRRGEDQRGSRELGRVRSTGERKHQGEAEHAGKHSCCSGRCRGEPSDEPLRFCRDLRSPVGVNKEVWRKRGVNERAGASQSSPRPIRLLSAPPLSPFLPLQSHSWVQVVCHVSFNHVPKSSSLHTFAKR